MEEAARTKYDPAKTILDLETTIIREDEDPLYFSSSDVVSVPIQVSITRCHPT